MTDISNFANLGVTAQQSATRQATSAATNALTSDFETFLRLMTTQAQYQDPLEPMDSSDFTAQLAQFSSVEQQVLTNETLASMSEMLAVSNMTQLTGWVGKEVRAPAAANFDGSTPVVVHPAPISAADRVQMVVYDRNENAVQTIQLPVSADPYEWTGTQQDGSALPAGNYTFVVESYVGDERIDATIGEVFGRVTETRSTTDGVALILESGTAILGSSVTALRETDA